MARHPVFHFDDVERARTIDFARRLLRIRYQAIGVLVPVVLAAVFTFGPLILAPLAGLLLAFAVVGPAMRRARRPERPLIALLLFTQLALVGMIAVGETFQLDRLGLLILPATAACILLPRRHVVVSVGWSVAVMVATAFAVDADGVIASPPTLILPIGVMLTVALPAAMIRQLQLASRDTAMVDTLTGALNRVAFEGRIAQLTAQAHVLPVRAGVIMADLDHFKMINDELGHDAGDLVLRETVRRMRTVLGPFTPVYRVGGEEFAVLIAGADEAETAAVAEQLRAGVRDDSLGDRAVTMSFGIAAGTLDEHPVTRLLQVADQALYRAKRAGRDRVAAANLTPMSVVPGAGGAAPLAPAPPETDTESGNVVVAPVAIALGSDRSNWLVRGDFERDHIRESALALSKTHHAALGFVGLALLASIPWLGWQLIVPAVPAVALYHVAERRVGAVRHPEYVLGGAWLLVQLSILAGAVIADPGEPYMLVLFSPLMIGMTAVFPTRGVVVGSAITAVLVLVAGVLARPDLVDLAHIGVAAPPLLVVVGIALMSSVTGRSAIEYRTRAVVDPLTGLLTRAALQSRVAEVRHESQHAATRVSVVAFDVDEFKTLNDTHGHAVGDEVLRAVGAATRSQLHALEWAFRLGGDEFVVVIPEPQDAAVHLAERLRSSLAELTVKGVTVTGSFGVASTAFGEVFDFDAVSRRADEALYEAKRGGRNRVAVAAPAATTPATAPGLRIVA